MRQKMQASPMVKRLYAGIPTHERVRVAQGFKGAYKGGPSFKVQIFIPVETYTVLTYFSALEDGPSTYFSRVAEDDIITRIYKVPALRALEAESRRGG